MGHKINAIGFRLQSDRIWESKWFANKKNYPILLHEDLIIRKFLAYFFRRKKIMLGRCYIKRFLDQIYIFNQILPVKRKIKKRLYQKFKIRITYFLLFNFIKKIQKTILKKYRRSFNSETGTLIYQKKIKKQISFFFILINLLKKTIYSSTKFYLALNKTFLFDISLKMNVFKIFNHLIKTSRKNFKLKTILTLILKLSNSKLLNYLLLIFIKRLLLNKMLNLINSKYNLIYLMQKITNLKKL